MTLRELLKKATDDPNNDDGYAQLFDEALHNCADELIKVVEAADIVFKKGPGGYDKPDWAALRDALSALREKESP